MLAHLIKSKDFHSKLGPILGTLGSEVVLERVGKNVETFFIRICGMGLDWA